MAAPKRLMLEDLTIEPSLDLTGPLTPIIAELNRLRDTYHARGWHALRIQDDYVDFEERVTTLVGNRMETDEEYAKRVKRRKTYLKRRREARRG